MSSKSSPVPVHPPASETEHKDSQRRSPLAKLWTALVWTGIFGTTAVVSAVAGAALVLSLPLPRSTESAEAAPPLSELWQSGFRYQVSRPVNLLVMGLDEARDIEGASPDSLVGRTDTMMLVRIDPETESVNLLSIPRDTRVEIPGYGIDKINQANVEGGAELAAQTVSHNFNQVEIDRYMRVNTLAFREIIDLIGGLEVFVPKPMQYEDKTQGLVIDLEPGWQTLSGEEAEQFARFRQDNLGDIGRVQRQQVLLKALRSRLLNPSVIAQLPQIIRILQEHIDTNLSTEEILALAGFGLQLDREALHMVMLPGRFSSPQEYRASYWVTDPQAAGKIMGQFFDADAATLMARNGAAPSMSKLRIAVQNAADSPRVATAVYRYLRQEGFQNVYIIQDWPDVHNQSEVVAQRGDLDAAQFVQSVLGTGTVASESTGDIQSDITIRVGNDWQPPSQSEASDQVVEQ